MSELPLPSVKLSSIFMSDNVIFPVLVTVMV